jgi:hypothetical protein
LYHETGERVRELLPAKPDAKARKAEDPRRSSRGNR